MTRWLSNPSRFNRYQAFGTASRGDGPPQRPGRGTVEPVVTATLNGCTERWDARPRDVCVLTETQAFNTPAAQAKKACSAAAMKRLLATPEISDEEVARIERDAPLNKVGR